MQKINLKNYITDEELVVIRKNSLGYVFPSLKEGFSLTPLEAQAVGLPCLISNIDVHREIYQDSVLYFDPLSEDDLVDKMCQLIKDESNRENLIKKGYEMVKNYNWVDTAKITLDIFKQNL